MHAVRENATRTATAALINEKACVSGPQECFGAVEHVLPGSAPSVNEQNSPAIPEARREKPALQ